MDPATICCPHLDCPARGPAGQGNLGSHSRQDQRFRCRQCCTTCPATQGPACSRRHTPVERMTLVITLLAHGCPLQAIVVAVSSDARTVADWLVRAGMPGQAVHAPRVKGPRDLGQVQADEIRVQTQRGIVWMAVAMMVRTRVWLAGEVSAPRDVPLSRRLVERVRACARQSPSLCCTDGVCADVRAVRETFRAAIYSATRGRPQRRAWPKVLLAPVVKRDTPRSVVAVERRLVQGAAAPGDGVINTASIERLNATFRARLAALPRPGRALARQTSTRPPGM